MSKSVIISCAATGGIHTPSISPHLPITPMQIAEQSVATPAESRQRLGLKGRESVGF